MGGWCEGRLVGEHMSQEASRAPGMFHASSKACDAWHGMEARGTGEVHHNCGSVGQILHPSAMLLLQSVSSPAMTMLHDTAQAESVTPLQAGTQVTHCWASAGAAVLVFCMMFGGGGVCCGVRAG